MESVTPHETAADTSASIPLAAVAELRLVLLRLGRRIRQQADSGLSPSQLSALSAIARHGPLRLGDLARRERIGKSSVTRVVAKLESKGNIERQSDPDDGRCARVVVTRSGQQLLEESGRRADAYLARQVAALTPEEQERLQSAIPVLQRLLDVRA